MNKFENAERVRISHDVTAGLVDPRSSIQIIQYKMEMIITAVLTQTLTMLEYQETQEQKDKNYARLRLNCDYFTDIVIPHSLKLDLLNGLQLTAQNMLDLYLDLSHRVQALENRVIVSYNSEPNIKALITWDEHKQRYHIDATTSRLSKKPKY